MTNSSPAASTYDPAAPASADPRPLAIVLGLGAGCHECGRPGVALVKVGRHKAATCEHHAAIVERVMRLQLAANRAADKRRRAAA